MKRRILLYFFSFLLITAISIFCVIVFLPGYLEINRYKNIIEDIAGEALGGEVSIGALDLSLKKGIEFVIKGFILNGPDGKNLLKVKKIHMFLKILPLIKNRMFVIKNLFIDSPYLMIESGDNTGWSSIFSHLSKQEKKKESLSEWQKRLNIIPRNFHFGLTSFLLTRSIRIIGGRVTYPDKSKKQPVDLNFNSLQLDAIPDFLKKSITFKTKLLFSDQGLSPFFKFTGKIENLSADLQDFVLKGYFETGFFSLNLLSDYLDRYFVIKDIDQILNLEGQLVYDRKGDYSIRGSMRSGSLNLNSGSDLIDPPKSHSVFFRYDLVGNSDYIKFREIEIKTNLITIKGEGSINALRNIDPSISFNVRSSEVEIDQAKPLFLLGRDNTFIPEKIKKAITEHIFGGTFHLKNIFFDGHLSHLVRADHPDNFKRFKGLVELKNIGIFNISPYTDIKGINGMITLKEGTLSFSDVNLVYQDCYIQHLSGSMGDVITSPYLDFNILADLEVVQTLELISKLISPQFLKKVMPISGKALLEASVTGEFLDPDSLIVEGRVQFEKARFTYGDIDLPFYDLRGELGFSQDSVVTRGLYWQMGDSDLSIHGKITNMKGEEKYDLHLKTALSGKDTRKLNFLTLDLNEDETWIGDLFLKGKAGDLQISGNIDLTNISYRYGGLVRKSKSVKNSIDFDGIWSNKAISIASFSLLIQDSLVKGSAVIPFSDTKPLEYQIVSNAIATKDLLKFLSLAKEGDDGGGYLKIDTTISIRKNELAQNRINGKLIFNNVNFMLQDVGSPISKLNGYIDFVGEKVFVPSITLEFDNEPVTVSGSLKGFEKPSLDFTVKAARLNLDSIFSTSKQKNEKASFYDNFPIKGFIIIDEGIYYNVPFGNLNLKFLKEKNNIEIKSFFVKAFGGKLSGRGSIRKGENPNFHLKIDLDSVQIKRISEELDIDELDEIDGKAKVFVSIYGLGKNTAEIKKTLRGETTIIFTEGTVYRFPVVSKIFSLLNPSQFLKFKLPDLTSDGMPYNYIMASFNISRGVARTENFLLDSDSIRMTGIGEVAIKDNTLDMMMGAQPFQTIDKVISNIPVLGKVLTGDKKSLIVSYYSVKGAINKPNVKALPVESVGQIINGILKRLINLPKDILKSGSN